MKGRYFGEWWEIRLSRLSRKERFKDFRCLVEEWELGMELGVF